MSSHDEIFADMPIKYRKLLFESHITDFGEKVHNKMHFRGKLE